MRRSTRDRGLLFLGFSLALGARALAQEPKDRPTLELTVDDVVKRALDNNSDIAVAKYNPESSLEGVRSAQGYYDPFASASLSKNKATTPGSNAFTGGNKVSNTTDTWNFGVSQYAPTGGTFSLSFNNNKQDTNSVFSTFNPTYNAS